MDNVIRMIATGDFPGYAVMGFEEDSWQSALILLIHTLIGA